MALISLAHLTLLDAHPLDLIDAAAAGGFDAFGLRIIAPLPTDTIFPVVGNEPLIRAIEARMDATGRRIFDIETVWLMPGTDVASLEPALALGSRLGARHLVVGCNDPDAGRAAGRFAALCDLAFRYGIGVALEPIPYTHLATTAQALALLERVCMPNAKLLIDALHLNRGGGLAADLARIDCDRVAYIHLCDAPAQMPPAEDLRPEGRGGRFYPGEGGLPLRDFLRAFPRDMTIGVEAPCGRYAGLSVQERARICGAATRALLRGVWGP